MSLLKYLKSLPLNLSHGFTLLEVMIAMTIMLISFASILAVQGNSLSTTFKARELNVVAMLAKRGMSMTEVEISGKKFNEMKAEESGVFEAPHQDYSWTRKIKEVKLPDIVSALASKKENASDEETKNNALLEQMGKLVTNYLSKALREVIFTVRWQHDGQERTFDVTMYWVDFDSDFSLTQ
jgi:prepilin-type N-terminal cleavage/methylation domain-containing protein